MFSMAISILHASFWQLEIKGLAMSQNGFMVQ
jgi:hypothetical protein